MLGSSHFCIPRFEWSVPISSSRWSPPKYSFWPSFFRHSYQMFELDQGSSPHSIHHYHFCFNSFLSNSSFYSCYTYNAVQQLIVILSNLRKDSILSTHNTELTPPLCFPLFFCFSLKMFSLYQSELRLPMIFLLCRILCFISASSVFINNAPRLLSSYTWLIHTLSFTRTWNWALIFFSVLVKLICNHHFWYSEDNPLIMNVRSY